MKACASASLGAISPLTPKAASSLFHDLSSACRHNPQSTDAYTMRVVLDNQLVPPATAIAAGAVGTCHTIAQTVLEAKQLAANRGRIIVDAHCAGQPVDLDLLDTQFDQSLPGHDELRLTSAEPAALVAAALRGIAESLTSLEAEQHRAATEICCGRVSQAAGRLPAISSVWERSAQTVGQAQQMLAVFDQVGASAAAAGIDAATARVHISALATHLKILKAALAHEDWSSLADLLEYGLCETAQSWAHWLNTAADALTPVHATR